MDLQFEIIDEENRLVKIYYHDSEGNIDNDKLFAIFYKLTKPKEKNDIILWKKIMYVIKTRSGLIGYISLLSFLDNNNFAVKRENYATEITYDFSFAKLHKLFKYRSCNDMDIYGVKIQDFSDNNIMDFMAKCNKEFLKEKKNYLKCFMFPWRK